MLQAQWHSETGTPVVFLHGLLGSQQDWQAVLAHLQTFRRIRPLTLDLPGHGKSQAVACRDFTDARTHLHHTLQHYLGTQPFYLVGYSLGGRLALDYALHADNPSLQHTILEGANLGLATEAERQARWQNDQSWAVRFRSEPLAEVLQDWYQQPVFADLDADKRSNLIEKRQMNRGCAIADMLCATSLAKQPNYAAYLHTAAAQNLTFFIGERDQKFRHMADEHSLAYQLITHAGHNAHRDNPAHFVEKLLEIIPH